MTLKSIDKDSIEPVTNESFSKKIKGKLIKGSTATATVPTIPSKYFTVVSDNSEKKGFLKSSKRFSYENADAPGPGSYANDDLNLKKETGTQKELKKPLSSDSKYRDYLQSFKNNTPGAGAYNIIDSIQRRNDFSRGYSRAFQKPIAEPKDSTNQKDNIPGPNQYDIEKSNKLKFRANNVCADAAFKSQSLRNAKISKQDEQYPAPGTYNVNENLKYQSAKVPFSSFKSSSKRISFTPISLSDIPGPADYHPYEEPHDNIVRQILPRRHYLAISAPAVVVSKDIITPGPGAYNLRSYEDNEKKYMSSAVFVSCTSRWTVDNTDTANPGPTNYSPLKPLKQSFHYNYERKWI